MATPANLDMLREAGMLAAEPDAGTSDLLVVVKGARERRARGGAGGRGG